jgi:zinc protease
MQKRKLFIALLLLGVLSTACSRRVADESAPKPSPIPDEQARIDEILRRCDEAYGGREAIDAIKSYKLVATFELLGVKGRLEGWRKEPRKTLSLMAFPGGTIKKGFDGEKYWLQTPAGTFVNSGEQEVAELERDSEVFMASKIRSLFETMKLEHNARLDGRDVYMIEGKPSKGPAEKLFFDVENGLLVRWDMARRKNGRTLFVKVHFNDYRDVSGVKVPFNVRFSFESFNFIIKVDSLETNIPIDDAVFQKP